MSNQNLNYIKPARFEIISFYIHFISFYFHFIFIYFHFFSVVSRKSIHLQITHLVTFFFFFFLFTFSFVYKQDVSTFHGIITLTHEVWFVCLFLNLTQTFKTNKLLSTTCLWQIYLPNVGPIYEKIFPELIKINPDIVVADISTFGAIFATQKLQFPLVLNNPSTLITNSVSFFFQVFFGRVFMPGSIFMRSFF